MNEDPVVYKKFEKIQEIEMSTCVICGADTEKCSKNYGTTSDIFIEFGEDSDGHQGEVYNIFGCFCTSCLKWILVRSRM